MTRHVCAQIVLILIAIFFIIFLGATAAFSVYWFNTGGTFESLINIFRIESSKPSDVINTESFLLPDSQRGDVSSQDLVNLAENLWNADNNRLIDQELRLAVQSKVEPRNNHDQSRYRLFERLPFPVEDRSLTFRSMFPLLRLYQPRVKIPEIYTEQGKHHVREFLQALLASEPISVLHRFLVDKGFMENNKSHMAGLLHALWFRLVPRSPGQSTADSSGFEHVFVGEIRGSKVIGFHNWLQFYLEEQMGNLNYHGYIIQKEPRIISTQFSWAGGSKSMSSFFVGTSPEFDIAIYTACFLTRPGRKCKMSINGNRFSIKTHDLNFIDGLQLASAYVET